MRELLLVGLGGALGSVLRHGVGLGVLRAFGPAFPVGTLLVNVVGSFVMGVLAELLVRRLEASPEIRLLLMTGFLGGFTTFSAFSLDAVSLYERGAPGLAAAYVGGSVFLGVGALLAGLVLVRQFA